jgi:hypothetical protein
MNVNHFMKRKAIVDIIAALLILLFTYTAVSKLMGLELFKILLAQSPGIGQHAGWLYIGIPAAELIVAALLFFPATKQKGLYASFVMMLAFTVYVGYMVKLGGNLPCSCGGVISAMSWQQHLYFNAFFTLAALTAAIINRKIKHEPPRNRPPVWAGPTPHG